MSALPKEGRFYLFYSTQILSAVNREIFIYLILTP